MFIPVTSCMLPALYIFQMINTAHEHKLFRFKNLNKNNPVTSCLFLSHHISTCLIYFKWSILCMSIYYSNLKTLRRKFRSHYHVYSCYIILLPALYFKWSILHMSINYSNLKCLTRIFLPHHVYSYNIMFIPVKSCMLLALYISNYQYCAWA